MIALTHYILHIDVFKLMQRDFRFNKDGDNHYDIISALIKSMSGSDPYVALYWLAVLLESGEDPRFIIRRIIVYTFEDVGLADPVVMLVLEHIKTSLKFINDLSVNYAMQLVYISLLMAYSGS